MIEGADAAAATPRAFLSVAGTSVARYQLLAAVTLECSRIICVARAIGPDLIALQHEAERSGMQFHVVTGVRGLLPLVTATDEVIAFADGLLASPDALSAQLSGPAVLVQPAETGMTAGFERIDLNHAAAGALRVPGRLVDRMSDLPPDCDAFSALLRVALQAGVPLREVPAEIRDHSRWRLVRSEAEAHEAEEYWFRQHAGSLPVTPGNLLARLAVGGIGPALLHNGKGGGSVAASALVLVLVALVAGWYRYVGTALVLVGFAWVAWRAAVLLERVRLAGQASGDGPVTGGAATGWLLDAAVVLLVLWLAPPPGSGVRLDHVFTPVMVLGLMRLLPGLSPARWLAWAEDRFFLAASMAAASVAGVLHVGLQGLALVLLLLALFLVRGRSGITPV